jgi:GNAT superfamily N-acetyltransferase
MTFVTPGSPAMTALGVDDLRQHADILRLRSGNAVTVRSVEPRDREGLQTYFRSLSIRSRYNRFLGAISELPASQLDQFIHVGEADRFSVVAVMSIGGAETIIGEARYAFDADTESFEFGLSVDDRWQGQGVGAALLRNLECRAAAFGANRLFGDTLRANDAMIGLARKSGFAFTNSPGDWKLIRFEKHIDIAPQEIPCASWRLAAQQIAPHASV